MASLPNVPTCSPDSEAVESPILKLLGQCVATFDKATNALIGLEGTGVPYQDPSGVKIVDGSKTNPLKFPKMDQEKPLSSFPFIVMANKAGQLKFLPANDGDTMRLMRSFQGSWMAEANPPAPCYNDSEICGDCEADFIAAFKQRTNDDGTVSLCLIKVDPEDVQGGTSDVFASSTSVEMLGNGSQGSPYSPAARISNASGNILVLDGSSGLLVRIPISAVSGNVLELKPDGLYVPTPTY